MCNEKQSSFLNQKDTPYNIDTGYSIKCTNISHVTCLYDFRCRCYYKRLLLLLLAGVVYYDKWS